MLVKALLEHGFVPDREPEVEREIAGDWLKALAEFSIDVVAEAKRRWIWTHDRQPKVSEFRELCRAEQDRHDERMTPRVEQARPMPTTWDALKHEVTYARWRIEKGGIDVRDRIRAEVGQQLRDLRAVQPEITVTEAFVALSNRSGS